MNNFKVLLSAFCVTSVLIWAVAFGFDYFHPQLPCFNFEKKFWDQRAGQFIFDRVSSFYWSSLCSKQPRPLIISASEGTGALSFPEAASQLNFFADEFTGAHRGLKTAAFLFSNKIHPERLKNLKGIVLINPVYFSFASTTDSASVRLTTLSNLSYILRIPHHHQKWDEFILSSLFIGSKSYLKELFKFSEAGPTKFEWPENSQMTPTDAEYDLERNMLKNKAKEFQSFDSKFTAAKQPSRYLIEKLSKFARKHSELPLCYVMLPTNTKNLRYFKRDAEQISKEMSELMELFPLGTYVDLQFLNEDPHIFRDPMHFTDFGKWKVITQVLKSECAKRVLQ